MANHDKIFPEGFGGYALATQAVALKKWTLQSIDPYLLITRTPDQLQLIGAYGRNGRSGVRFVLPDHSGIGFFNSLSKTMPTVNDTCIGTVAFRYSAPQFTDLPIVSVLDGADTQTSIVLNLDGTFSAYRGNHGTGTPVLLGTSTFVASAGSFTNINWRVKVHGSAGTVDVWFNGDDEPDLSLSGVNTQATGNARWTAFGIGMRYWSHLFSSTPATTWDYCDLLVYDGTVVLSGLSAGDPPGDAEAIWLNGITGNGEYSEFTPSAGVNHGDLIKDNPHDGDSTNCQGGPESGVRDLYFTEQLPSAGGVILLVASEDTMRKVSTGTAKVTPFVRSEDVDTDSDALHVLPDTYARFTSVFLDFGGEEITPALVNAMQLGPKTA